MKKKRVLVLGASILQKPLIDKVIEDGYYLGIVDYNENAVCVEQADEFFCVSTTDEKGVYEVAKKFKADAIVTTATDMPVRSIAYSSEKLGLTSISYESSLKATDKALMIQSFEKDGVPHPWYFVLEKENNYDYNQYSIKFPCVIKPTDSSGSRGVKLVDSVDKLNDAIIYSKGFSRNGSVIVEEYLVGQEISIEVMRIDGVSNILAVTKKETTGSPYFVELGHSQPANIEQKLMDELRCLVSATCESIGVKNGPAHIEVMITKEGPKVIEMGARMGGDFITSNLVPLSTGIDMIELMLEISLNEKVVLPIKKQKGSAIRYFKINPGKIKSITRLDDAKKLPGIVEIEICVKEGDNISEIKNSRDRIGHVIAEGDNEIEAIANAERAIKMIKIEVENER